MLVLWKYRIGLSHWTNIQWSEPDLVPTCQTLIILKSFGSLQCAQSSRARLGTSSRSARRPSEPAARKMNHLHAVSPLVMSRTEVGQLELIVS
jgi:hypothetical protein